MTGVGWVKMNDRSCALVEKAGHVPKAMKQNSMYSGP